MLFEDFIMLPSNIFINMLATFSKYSNIETIIKWGVANIYLTCMDTFYCWGMVDDY